MKQLILSTSMGYDWSKIKTWNLSAKKTGHDVCNLLINPDQELLANCRAHGVDAVHYKAEAGPRAQHNLRFFFQYKYLMSVAEQYSHVVLTDSRDVFFHHDPFPRLNELMQQTGKAIVCGSECIRYQDEAWGSDNLRQSYGYVFNEYKSQEIANVGVLCGEPKLLAELCLLIFSMSLHNPARVSDQSSFNILMGTEFGQQNIAVTRPSDGLMVHLGTVAVEEFQDKLLENPSWDLSEFPQVDGKKIAVIHQYDRIDTQAWNML